MQNTVRLKLLQTEIAAVYAYTVFRSSVSLFDASWLDSSIIANTLTRRRHSKADNKNDSPRGCWCWRKGLTKKAWDARCRVPIESCPLAAIRNTSTSLRELVRDRGAG